MDSARYILVVAAIAAGLVVSICAGVSGDAEINTAEEYSGNVVNPKSRQRSPDSGVNADRTVEDGAIGKAMRPDHESRVALSNEITDNIARHRWYLKNLYDRLGQFQENPQTNFRPVAEYLRRRYDHANADALSPSDQAQAMQRGYNSLCDLNGTLSAYIKLEDYNTDGAVQGMKILDDMSAEVAYLAAERNRLRDSIYLGREHVLQNEHGKAYRMMIDIIAHEEKVLAHLDAIYQDNPSSGLDEAFVIRSYVETADLLAAFEREYNIHYPDPAGRFSRSFPESIRRLQKVKQKAVDENDYRNQNSTRHVNEFCETYAEYFNNEVLSTFGYFVKTVRRKSSSICFYPKYLPLLRYKDSALDTRVEPRPFTAKQVPPLDAKPRTDAMDRAAYDVLNGYIEALNIRTKSLDNIRTSLKNFQDSLAFLKRREEASRRNCKLGFYNDAFLVPEIDFAVLLRRSPESIPDYSAQLLAQFDNIQGIMLACESLCRVLAVYVESKQYQTAGPDRAEAILNRFQALLDTYRNAKERLYRDVRAVYDAYRDDDPDNPWKVTSRVMLRATDTAKAFLQAIKDGRSQEISTAPLLSNRREMVENQDKYMAGIRRLGRNNGRCPYNPYEDITEELKSMIEKIGRTDAYAGNGRCGKYNDYVYVYNRMVENYNKFAELARGDADPVKDDARRPVYILFQVRDF